MAKNCRFNSAVWAKEKAEAKFKVQDYQGAVDCAYVAKGIFPGLDGIDDMLAAYQVHLAAAKKDWPAVLGVDDSANLGEIKKQYKRKAMSVHPDKNSSEAATDAFKFIMEAYEVLSKNNQSALGSSWNKSITTGCPCFITESSIPAGCPCFITESSITARCPCFITESSIPTGCPCFVTESSIPTGCPCSIFDSSIPTGFISF